MNHEVIMAKVLLSVPKSFLKILMIWQKKKIALAPSSLDKR